MKLIACPACSKSVSEEARICPACGQPIGHRQRRLKWVKYGFAFLFAIAGLWFLISTWTGIQQSIKGPVEIGQPPKK
jgi:predicted nucleic acid-binding Zn ribbon protein